MWDWAVDTFTSAVSSAGSWLDSTFGTATTSTLEMGSTAEWLAFDKVGFDQIGAVGSGIGADDYFLGISGLGTFESAAYNAMGFVSDAVSFLGTDTIADMVGSPFGDDTKYPGFADKSGRSQRMAGISSNFQASKSRYPGTNDPRIQQAWRQARNSTNPSLLSAISAIDPNIIAKTNLSLSPAVIKRRKAYGA